jgi:replicative DNA helicase
MPANADAERSILGAALIDNFAVVQAQAGGLRADEFSLDAHRRIYARMLEMHDAGTAIDIITLTEHLQSRREIEAVGGVAYVSSLTEGLPHRPNIEHYVRIVRDKAVLRGLIHTSHATIERATSQTEPADDVVAAAEAEIFRLADGRAEGGPMDVRQIVESSFGSIDALFQRSGTITGLPTHYADFDAITSGLQPADLIIVAARPSMGKTAFAMNIAENIAVIDRKITLVFSLEMSRESLLLRMMCSRAEVNSHLLRTGSLGRADREKLTQALEDLLDAPLYVDDTPALSVSDLRARCRRLQHQASGLDLVIVDYLGLMDGGASARENRTQEVSAISRGLKQLAKELHVPVVALSQLNRSPETRGNDHEPKLSDLRDSGSIEQDADVVCFLYRPEYYDRDDPELQGKAKLNIAKQRNGPTETLQLAFLKQCTKFKTLARDQWLRR